jgi:shikimate kinase
MGAGKSRVGKLLADMLGYRFLDLDTEIEAAEKRDISTIFRESGEAYFRVREGETGLACITGKRHVVALGGGAVMVDELFDALLSRTCLVYLRARPQVLWGRVKRKQTRPLVASIKTYDEFRAIYRERMSVRRARYERAHLIVDTGAPPAEQTASQILSLLDIS